MPITERPIVAAPEPGAGDADDPAEDDEEITIYRGQPGQAGKSLPRPVQAGRNRNDVILRIHGH
jgi:hypothetical protein